MYTKTIFFVLATLMLSGCYSTQEQYVTQNQIALAMGGEGLIATTGLDDAIIRKAAAITLREGYTHFTLQPLGRYEGTSVGVSGTVGYTRLGGGTASTIILPIPSIAPVAARSVVITMYRPGDKAPIGAIDAKTIVSQ